MMLTEPNEVLEWARQVEADDVGVSHSKLESDKFVASYISMHVRIALGVQDVLDAEQIDENDQ